MQWKRNIQARDLDDNMHLECTCSKCGKTYYLYKKDILKHEGAGQLYLDEVEARCRCRQRGCNGRIECLLIEPGKVTGWVGGMP